MNASRSMTGTLRCGCGRVVVICVGRRRGTWQFLFLNPCYMFACHSFLDSFSEAFLSVCTGIDAPFRSGADSSASLVPVLACSVNSLSVSLLLLKAGRR